MVALVQVIFISASW
jgi:hypothetical protein